MRATIQAIANDLKITGWVKNMPNGSVMLEAEGPENKLEVLLKQVEISMGHKITRIDRQFRDSIGFDKAFEILYL